MNPRAARLGVERVTGAATATAGCGRRVVARGAPGRGVEAM